MARHRRNVGVDGLMRTLSSMPKEMENAAGMIDDLPEDAEWTMNQLADLEDVRHAALKLVHRVEAILTGINGGGQ
jgi:hypothetical protein